MWRSEVEGRAGNSMGHPWEAHGYRERERGEGSVVGVPVSCPVLCGDCLAPPPGQNGVASGGERHVADDPAIHARGIAVKGARASERLVATAAGELQRVRQTIDIQFRDPCLYLRHIMSADCLTAPRHRHRSPQRSRHRHLHRLQNGKWYGKPAKEFTRTHRCQSTPSPPSGCRAQSHLRVAQR